MKIEKILPVVFVGLLFSACRAGQVQPLKDVPPPKPACETFHNQCSFDVSINGQTVVPFDSKDILARLEPTLGGWQVHDLRETKWQVAEPTSGKNFKIDVSPNSYTQGYYGAPSFETSINVEPLGDQKLISTTALLSPGNVKVGGKGVVTKGAVLKSNDLPPGEYIIWVNTQGTKTWDRKKIYVRVSE